MNFTIRQNTIIYNTDDFNSELYFNITDKYEYEVDDITFIKSKQYYEFNDLTNINYNKFKNLLYRLLQTSTMVYYIFKNFSKISKHIQYIIKNLMEKYIFVKFIFVTKKLQNLSMLSNRCACIRINSITNYERYNELVNKFKLSINDYTIYRKYSDNYISIVYNKQLINKSDFIGDLLKYILNLNSIKQINQLSYLILTTNIPITIVFHDLLQNLLSNNKIINEKKYKIVELFAKTEYMYTKSYYKMIYIEYLLIGLKNIINNK